MKIRELTKCHNPEPLADCSPRPPSGGSVQMSVNCVVGSTTEIRPLVAISVTASQIEVSSNTHIRNGDAQTWPGWTVAINMLWEIPNRNYRV